MLYIIIVLYKTKLEDSLTFKALKKNLSLLKDLGSKILIYNNSPEIEIPQSNDYVIYTPTENLMLAGAYNYALQKAIENKAQWLLLLDQDTELNQDYFERLNAFLNKTDVSSVYDVVVPTLSIGDKHLSPIAYYKSTGPFISHLNKPLRNNEDVVKYVTNEGKNYAAFNSASLLSIEILQRINGFDENYPLDMLDHKYYHLLNKLGAKIYILDAHLKHTLSLLEKENTMSVTRYQGYIDKCFIFAKELGFTAVLVQKLRMLISVMANIIFSSKRKYFKASISNLCRIK
jgi:GT2 family glycosyltransferase